jgi:hypothetical protein
MEWFTLFCGIIYIKFNYLLMFFKYVHFSVLCNYVQLKNKTIFKRFAPLRAEPMQKIATLGTWIVPEGTR